MNIQWHDVYRGTHEDPNAVGVGLFVNGVDTRLVLERPLRTQDIAILREALENPYYERFGLTAAHISAIVLAANSFAMALAA